MISLMLFMFYTMKMVTATIFISETRKSIGKKQRMAMKSPLYPVSLRGMKKEPWLRFLCEELLMTVAGRLMQMHTILL